MKELIIKFDIDELMHEIELRSAYLSKQVTLISEQDSVQTESMWLTADELPLIKRLLAEGYTLLFNALSGYLVDGDGCLCPNGEVVFEFLVDDSLPIVSERLLRYNLQQALVSFILHRWLADKNGEQSAYQLSLTDNTVEEIKRALRFRPRPIRRKWYWW